MNPCLFEFHFPVQEGLKVRRQWFLSMRQKTSVFRETRLSQFLFEDVWKNIVKIDENRKNGEKTLFLTGFNTFKAFDKRNPDRVHT